MSTEKAKVYTSTGPMKLNSVYISSAWGIMYVLFVAESQELAKEYCIRSNWEWMDDNNFCWHLNYKE